VSSDHRRGARASRREVCHNDEGHDSQTRLDDDGGAATVACVGGRAQATHATSAGSVDTAVHEFHSFDAFVSSDDCVPAKPCRKGRFPQMIVQKEQKDLPSCRMFQQY